MWLGFVNMLASYADNASPVSFIPSIADKQLVSESLNKALAKLLCAVVPGTSN